MSATPTVESLHEQWVAAFNAHDLDRHMALYAEDAMLFGAVDELQDGRGAIRAYFGKRGPEVRVKSYPMPLDAAGAGGQRADVAITAGHVDFAVARADDYADWRYGLICFFDTLHDLGDPVAAARHATEVLAPGSTVLLVEPFAHDRIEDNLSPVAQLYYSASATICCAHAISEGGALVLGAQAG